MIPVDSLLYKIDQKLNKLSTNAHQQIQLEDKILALNEAQIKLIKQKVDGIAVANGMGMDSFKKRYEDLQSLVVAYNDGVLPLTLADPILNRWAANVHALEPKYMFYVDSYILADKGRCTDRQIWINRDLAKHGDLQFIVNNIHYKPSFEYQETFNWLSSDELSIFTDGTFTPTELKLDYIRKPAYIHNAQDFLPTQSYTLPNGTVLVGTQNCELPEHTHREIVDIAVLITTGNLQIPDYQIKQAKMNLNN